MKWILFTADNHVTGHVSSAFPGAQDHRTRSSTVNKSPSESMSFITEVICKFIFTDVHMRNNCRPNRALVSTSPLLRIHPPHRCGISRCWLNSMIIAQVCLRLATIKGHSKMCSFITQHNATDVASFEGACNWHADCRNVHQSCCSWIEC